jgi:pimeloyl-ACP methyl ester carboxylesterase
MTPLADLVPSTITLSDGRTLGYYELGDPTGEPCLYCPGTPTSGVVGIVYDDDARRAGVRLISVDKPGYGRSSVDPQRSLLRFSQDIAALLDHLGLERVAALGESGGGPHVLTLAHDLPDRIRIAVCGAGLGPGSEAWVREGMWRTSRNLLWLAARAPKVVELSMALMSKTVFAPGRRAAFERMVHKPMPAPDRRVLAENPAFLDAFYASTVDAFRLGPRGAADEFRIFARPWHFAVEDIRVPLELWHGAHDVNVPVTVAKEIHRRVPHSKLRLKPDSGHLLYEHREELLAAVAKA